MKIALSVSVTVFILSLCTAAIAQPMQVILRLKERVPLEQLAANVMNPDSNRYHKYYSPDDIADISGPTVEQIVRMKYQLRTQNMRVVSMDQTGLFWTVEADSQDLERVFATHVLPTASQETGMMEMVQVAPVKVPDGLDLVESVIGLDTSHHRRPHLIIAAAKPKDGAALSPDQVKSLYGFNSIYASGLTGKGQDIAIGTYDGFNISDVKGFYSQIKLAHAPHVDQVVFNGVPAINNDSAVETETDAEFSGMIAPGAKIHVFASTHNDDAGEVQIFLAILDDNRAKIANYSWGECETQVAADHKADMDKVFARALAQGVNIMIASGDSGSDGCGDGTNAADWPASHPDVIAVGGTTGTVTNGALAETAWSGSGGGISALFSAPLWQAELTAPYNAHRSFPDVSFNADPNTGENAWVRYQDTTPNWIQIGGTSIAAPQWSGFMALVNEARGRKGTLGAFNPILYGLSADQRAAFLHDVTQGSNGLYNAGPGWDAVTGWGSMQADAFLGYLKGL